MAARRETSESWAGSPSLHPGVRGAGRGGKGTKTTGDEVMGGKKVAWRGRGVAVGAWGQLSSPLPLGET